MRRKRVNRLKKMIVAFILLMIIIPWVLFSLSLIQNRKTKESLKDMSESKAKIEEELSERSEKAAVYREMVELLQADISEYRAMEEEKAAPEDADKPVPIITESENGIRDYKSPDGIKRVYITFDDGPSSNTEHILDILDEYRVKATFFVVGNSTEEGQKLYRRIIAGGHSIGIHSYTHKYSEIYKDTDAFLADFRKLSDYIYDVTGFRTRICRLPGGSSNNVSKVDMAELIDILHSQDIKVFDWNISGRDAEGYEREASEIAASVLAGIEEFDTCIILLHDGADKDTTVEALPLILDGIMDREDVEILPITEDTPEILHIFTEF